MARRECGCAWRTPGPAMLASASGLRSEENVPPGGTLDSAPSSPSASRSRPPLRAIQLQGQPQPRRAIPCKGKKPMAGERSAKNVEECSDTEGSILKRTQASLEEALNLNARYQQELASRTSIEQDQDETSRQVKDELAKVITDLTEEAASLREQLDVSNKREEYYVSLLKRREELRQSRKQIWTLLRQNMDD